MLQEQERVAFVQLNLEQVGCWGFLVYLQREGDLFAGVSRDLITSLLLIAIVVDVILHCHLL